MLNSAWEANGDVIVVLSDEDGFNPFAVPLPALESLGRNPELSKIFVGPPAARSGCSRTGARVGLGHNEDATSLMCSGRLVPL
jgi:hypothetical protein